MNRAPRVQQLISDDGVIRGVDGLARQRQGHCCGRSHVRVLGRDGPSLTLGHDLANGLHARTRRVSSRITASGVHRDRQRPAADHIGEVVRAQIDAAEADEDRQRGTGRDDRHPAGAVVHQPRDHERERKPADRVGGVRRRKARARGVHERIGGPRPVDEVLDDPCGSPLERKPSSRNAAARRRPARYRSTAARTSDRADERQQADVGEGADDVIAGTAPQIRGRPERSAVEGTRRAGEHEHERHDEDRARDREDPDGVAPAHRA